MGGVGNAAGGVPDGVAQGARGAGVFAEVTIGAGSVGKARWCCCGWGCGIARYSSCYRYSSYSSFTLFYILYRFVYHYLSQVHHAAEGVVEELVVASDEAEPRLHRPTALQERCRVAEEMLRERGDCLRGRWEGRCVIRRRRRGRGSKGGGSRGGRRVRGSSRGGGHGRCTVQAGVQFIEHRFDSAVVVAAALVVSEHADHYRRSPGHQFARVVALLAVALEVRHIAVQALRHPLLHERRVIVQPLGKRHTAVVETDR